MGMIPLPVAETLPASPSGGFTRLSRQPDGQGEEYQPLDLPQEAMLPPSTAPSAPVDETEQAESVEVAADVAEQLAAFNQMPPPFVRQEEGRLPPVRLSSSAGLAPVGEMQPASSPVLRALSGFERMEGERMPVPPVSVGKESLPQPAGELAMRMLQPTTQGERPTTRSAAVVAPLPGEPAPEREASVTELKVMAGLSPALSAARPAEYQWAPARLAASEAQWGQQLVDVLKDRVELQVNHSIKQAHIRLDPPELGRVELTVRMEGDRLNVQLNVTNPAVREALIQSMERLRMSLAPHHAGGVEVNVGQGGEQERGDRWQQEKILAGRRQWQEEQDASGSAGQDWLNTLV
jgi:flagellar hook-length control protein FliK